MPIFCCSISRVSPNNQQRTHGRGTTTFPQALIYLFFAIPIVVLPLAGTLGCKESGLRLITLEYLTDWTGGLSSYSQRIRLVDPLTGALVQERVMNNDTGERQAMFFSGLNPGSYVIHVSLYSQPNATGSVLGVINDLRSVNSANKRYSTKVAGKPASAEVVPTNIQVQVQHSIQLYATVRDTAGNKLFTLPGSFTWTALNTNASVNASGIAIGLAEGQAFIRATDTASGLFNTALLQVVPFVPTQTKWTILVFINAANDLDQFSDLNVNQMERVANNPQVRFVLQWKRVESLGFGAPWTGTRRYLVKFDSSSDNSWAGVRSQLIQDMGAGVDMGDKNTLRQFITWGQTYFPAQRCVVIVWNHGSGWRLIDQTGGTRGVSFDDEFFTYIKTWELKDALNVPQPIEVLSWDASLMQMMEVAHEVQDRCNFMVGSEESPPAQGLPYHLVFAPLRNDPDISTETLLRSFGEGMIAYYGENFKITQSSLRTSQLTNLANALDVLAGELIAKAGSYNAQIIAARNQAQSYSPSPTRVYRDIWHLAFTLKALIPDAEIDVACDGVMTALTQAIVHNHHNANSPNSHGLSIDFGSASQAYWSEYASLAFAQDTRWDEWCQIAP